MITLKHTLLTVTFIGVFFIIAGFFGVDYMNREVARQISEKLPPINGSDSARKWENFNQEGLLSIYLFHINNSKELKEGKTTQVQLQEVGPFVYNMIPTLIIEGWSADNERVTYRKVKKYVFNATLSKYPISTEIITLNVPLISTVTAAMERQKNSIFISTFKMTLNHYIRKYGETLFIKRTANELLFKGYKVPMVEDLLTAASWVMDVQTLPNGTFGMFYGKNNSDQGEFEVWTGHNGLWRTGRVHSWDKLSNNTCYLDAACNRINGGDGIRFSPFLDSKANSTLELYVNQYRRVLELEFSAEEDLKRIPTYAYKLGDHNLAATKNNTCHCLDPNKMIGNTSMCAFSGIQDISPCEKNVPIVMSQPHFLNASPELQSLYKGLHPDKRQHKAFLNVDKLTGIILGGELHAQISFHVQKYEGVDEFDQVNPMLVPILWVKEKIVISDDKAAILYETIHQRIVYLNIIGCAVIGFGCTVFLIGAIGFLWVLTRPKKKPSAEETSMYATNKQFKSNARYNQNDVKSQEEVKQL